MKKITRKFFAAILALSLFAGFSASVASFAAEENIIDPTKKEYYIDRWDCYPGGQFFVYLSNNTVFSVTLHEGKFITEYAKFRNDQDDQDDQIILIPETLFGLPVEVNTYTWFYPPI